MGVVLALAPQLAFADPVLRHEDVEAVRAELRTMTGRTYEMKQGKLVETAREVRAYDRAGRIARHERRKPDGTIEVGVDYTWDANGRLATHAYRDHTGRTEVRTYAYKLDPSARILERTLRNPAAPAGEYLRDVYQWRTDGGRDVTTYRHYAKEGPYRSSTESYDAKNRLERACSEHGSCSMYEYDRHGDVTRIRQQTADDHHYLVFTSEYDPTGRLIKRVHGPSETRYVWSARGDIGEVITSQGKAVTMKTVYTYAYR